MVNDPDEDENFEDDNYDEDDLILYHSEVKLSYDPPAARQLLICLLQSEK